MRERRGVVLSPPSRKPVDLTDHVLDEDKGETISGSDDTASYLVRIEPKLRRGALYVLTAPEAQNDAAPRIEATLNSAPLTVGPVNLVASEPGGRVWRATFPKFWMDGDKARSADLRVTLDGVLLQNSSINVYPRIEGRVEVINRTEIRGWAIDFGLPPGQSAKVELTLNGVPLIGSSATRARPDLEKLFPDRGHGGFTFNFDPTLLAEGLHEVGVRGGDGRTLRNNVTAEVQGTRPLVRLERLAEDQPVTIVVPVYNAPDDVAECVERLKRHTRLLSGRTEIILLDDASPDPAVAPVLARHADHPAITVVRHPQNVGYTSNINHGIDMAGRANVVLLNSDARVGPGWLARLRTAAAQRESIGTVTAVSDNAGAFSVPVMNAATPPPAGMNEEDYARAVMHHSEQLHPVVPTGSGFCMYIKRAMLDDIGIFNEVLFPRGYGEENEFCMRAMHAGWENVVADDAMVFHERSASFKAAKDTLIKEASNLLPKLYPEYRTAVRRTFLHGMEMNLVRHTVKRARSEAVRPRPRVAFVIGVDTGGTPQTNMDLMSSIHEDFEPWLLLCQGSELIVFRIVGRTRVEVERHAVNPPVDAISHDSPAYRRIVADLLQRFCFELVHIRHIARHGLHLVEAARRLDVPVVFSLHDFYMVCPNVKLLDAEGHYCGGQCTKGKADCQVELWKSEDVPPLRNQWIRSWQARMGSLLGQVDHLVTTSPTARNVVRDVYGLDDVPFSVIEHGRDFSSMHRAFKPLVQGEKLRVVVPGNLSVPKGLAVIEAVHEMDIEGRIEFHFFGNQARDISALGINHGPYDRDDLPSLIAEINPHVGAVLSIWPETYSHTLTELWSCGLPVLGGGLGATGERIRRHGGGWALDDMSPETVYATMLGLAGNPGRLTASVKEVHFWQEGYGRGYSIAAMAARYRRIYWSLLDAGAPRAHVMSIGVGTQINGAEPEVSAVLENLVGCHRLNRLPSATPAAMAAITGDGVDAVVVHYSGEPAGSEAEAMLAALPDVPLVLKIATGAGNYPVGPLLAELRARAVRQTGAKGAVIMAAGV
jgi:GT2 family glycosyltransferase